MTPEQILEELKQYIDNTMAKNRGLTGKFNKENWALWKLKKKLKEMDSTVSFVGETFDEHEHSDFDLRSKLDKEDN